MPMKNREAYIFAAEQAVSTVKDYEKTIRAVGTVTTISVRIYDGPETALRLQVFKKNQLGELQSLVQYSGTSGAKDYIDGNDDTFKFDIRVPIEREDKLIVRANNTSASYAYDFAVHIEIDFATWAQQYG